MCLMADFSVAHGLTLPAVLAGTGITEAQLMDPDLLVRGEQELRLIRNMLDRLGDPPALGIEVGQCYHFTAFGVLGLAIFSNQTLRAALDVALQYFDLTFAFTTFRVEESGQQTRLVLDDEDIPEGLRQFNVERDMTAFLTVVRDLFVAAPIQEAVHLRLARPDSTEPYRRVFGVEPAFGMPHNAILLDSKLLAERLPQANALAQSAARDQCRKLLDARRARIGLAARVRDLLAARCAEMPDMTAAAGSLFMTARTLRRRLQDEGTTYAELRDEVRQTLAEAFLSGPHQSIDQIAARLGYAEATSFINAFRRWRGQTPHAFRLALRTASYGSERR
ncbi:transcriptional regulator [Cupriavidus basilensis OR16]|uniref:Transcriptional regulator n=2 Tax=Cupriavidus basilensis TaxID=68895 RepID=H1RYI5_9BURK|nr:transcriptional regulator [Cupriavidus basilensis OR16]